MKVSGKLIDSKTKEEIPYAKLYIMGDKSISTTSSVSGVFSLDSDKILPNSTIVIQHIGYGKILKGAKDIKDGKDIPLKEKTYEVGAVEVSDCKKNKIKVFGKCVNKYLVIGSSLAVIGITATLIMGKTKKWF